MASKDRLSAQPDGSKSAPPADSRGAHVLGLLALAAIIALSSFARIHTALSDRSFDRHSAKGLLRTDPAILHYFTERIVEARGRAPDDLRADPNIEFPEISDWAAMETVGQEFVVAWAKLWFAADTPVHVVAIIAMGICASFAAAGVFGLAYELTRRVVWYFSSALHDLGLHG